MLGPEGHVKSGQLSSHQHAAVDLPASLFHQINDHTSIGIFFMLYETTTLFPVDDEESVNSNETEVGSHVLSVTVGSGLNFQDLLHNITILLRLTSNNVRVAKHDTYHKQLIYIMWAHSLQLLVQNGVFLGTLIFKIGQHAAALPQSYKMKLLRVTAIT